MVMDGYYIHDRKPELWAKINSLHLSYLEMPESPQKLEHKIKLEDCIKKYLCVAPHNQKFCFKETAEVLHRSASNKKDFSGYRAALGWNAIGMYAGNLISQPWRQEYREIKMYSGFYKHQIESNLVGAEIMFEAMGYKHAGNGIMILEGPVCPDTVKYVSQDSLVAYVECQILKEIWEEVSVTYKISWLDVLEFRETHLCSPKKSIDGLKYQIQQRQFQEQQQQQQQQQRSYTQGNNDEYISNNCRYPNHLHQHITSPTALIPNHSFPPLTGHTHHVPMPPAMISPPQLVYNNGYYPNSYGTYGMLPAVYPPNSNIYGNMMKPYNAAAATAGYYCNGYAPQPYVVPAPVPTAQLIEIDSQLRSNYDATDSTVKLPPQVVPTYTATSDENDNKNEVEVKVNNLPKTFDKDEVTGTFESWDYVYRNLESQGYSKDLGERGDVLNVNRKNRESELKVNDRPMKINEALEKMKLYDKPKKIENNITSDAVSSSYDNLSTQELVRRVTPIEKTRTSSVIMEKETPSDNSQQPQRFLSKTLDLRKLKMNQSKPKSVDATPSLKVDREVVKKVVDMKDKWQCFTCTYINDNSKNICDICSKSRVMVSQEMEIGGSECSKCTFVNRKSNKVCDMCGMTLQNSPTYI